MLVRLRWLVVATVFGSLVGFLVSYLFIPRYSASAVLEVRDDGSRQCRGCGLPDKSYFQHKLANYLQQVFSLNNLRALMERKSIARPEDIEKVYREIHKKMTVRVGGDAESPDIDLIYTDSTPQRTEEFCSLLTSAIGEKTRGDEEVADRAFFNAGKAPSGPVLIIGSPPQPYGLEVLLPCTSGTRDLSHSILSAAIGSTSGLLIGIGLVSAHRKSFSRIAESRG
jgi:hypothetical protein